MDFEPILRAAAIGASYSFAALYVGKANTSVMNQLKNPQQRHRRPMLALLALIFFALGFVLLLSMMASLRDLGENVAMRPAVAGALFMGVVASFLIAFTFERLVRVAE